MKKVMEILKKQVKVISGYSKLKADNVN